VTIVRRGRGVQLTQEQNKQKESLSNYVMEYEASRTVTETVVQTNLRWDPAYIRSLPGALKTAAVIVNLACFICVMFATPYYKELPVGEWVVFVAMTAFWVSLSLLLMYLLHAIEKFHVIPWLMIEFGFYALWSFFYFTAGVAAAVEGPHSSALGAAAFFCFLGLLLYGGDAVVKWRGWRAGRLAQGERTVSQSAATQR